MTKSTMKRLGGLTLGLALMGSLATGSFAAEPQNIGDTAVQLSACAVEIKPQANCPKCTAFLDMDAEARNQFIADNKDESGNTNVCEHLTFGDSVMVQLSTSAVPAGSVELTKLVDVQELEGTVAVVKLDELKKPEGAVELKKFVDVQGTEAATATTPSLKAVKLK